MLMNSYIKDMNVNEQLYHGCQILFGKED